MVLKGYYETNFQPDVLSHGLGRGIAASELSLFVRAARLKCTRRIFSAGVEGGRARCYVECSSSCHSISGMGNENVGWEASAACKVRKEHFPDCLSIVSIFWWLFPDVRDKMELHQDGCLRQIEVVVWSSLVLFWKQMGCHWQETAGFSIRKKKKGVFKGIGLAPEPKELLTYWLSYEAVLLWLPLLVADSEGVCERMSMTSKGQTVLVPATCSVLCWEGAKALPTK